MVLWPTEVADQLWAPVYQGDGTWTLRNYVTGQLLTAVNSGDALVGRDFDDSPAQRWFLEAPERAGEVFKIALEDSLRVLEVNFLEEEPFPVDLIPDADYPEQRFTLIDAGQTGEDPCYYLAYDGLYVNSTVGHPREPLDGSPVTLTAFRSNDDGYLWCTYYSSTWMYLSNHTTPDERLYLTPAQNYNDLIIRPAIAGVASWTFRRVQ